MTTMVVPVMPVRLTTTSKCYPKSNHRPAMAIPLFSYCRMCFVCLTFIHINHNSLFVLLYRKLDLLCFQVFLQQFAQLYIDIISIVIILFCGHGGDCGNPTYACAIGHVIVNIRMDCLLSCN